MSCAKLYWVVYPSDQRIPTGRAIIAQTVSNALFGNDESPTIDFVDFLGSEIGTLSFGQEYNLSAVWYDDVNMSPIQTVTFETAAAPVVGGIPVLSAITAVNVTGSGADPQVTITF